MVELENDAGGPDGRLFQRMPGRSDSPNEDAIKDDAVIIEGPPRGSDWELAIVEGPLGGSDWELVIVEVGWFLVSSPILGITPGFLDAGGLSPPPSHHTGPRRAHTSGGANAQIWVQ